MSYEPKVHRLQGGNELDVDSAGIILLMDGAYLYFGDSSDITLTFDGTNLVITGLPTSDPSSTGALYNDSGTVKISA